MIFFKGKMDDIIVQKILNRDSLHVCLLSWQGCVAWCVVGNYLLAPGISSLRPDVSLME